MKAGLKITIPLVTVVLLLLGSSVQAEDFGQLLKAVDRVEASLKDIIERETKARKKETAELRKQLQQVKKSESSSEMRGDQMALIDDLKLEVKALKAEVERLSEIDRLSNAQPAPSVTESDLVSIINDIEFLKSEILFLRTMANDNKTKLASIDEEGFYQPPPENDQLEQLTRRLIALNAQLEKAIANQPKPEKPINAPIVKRGKIGFGGYVHEHYTTGESQTTTFVTKRARLSAKGDINQCAQIKIEGEFAKSPELTDGYLTISPHTEWSFKLGQYKPPFGTDFLTSSTAMPFVNSSRAKSLGTGRDVGLSVSYRNKFSKEYGLKLSAGMFNGSGPNTSDVNNHKNIVARAEVDLAGMFTVAPNFYYGRTNEVDSLKDKISNAGASVAWSWKRETVVMEYIYSKEGNTRRGGWYAWGAHSIPIGSGFLQEIQLLARYEQYDPNLDNSGNRKDRVTLGTNLFIDKKYTKIQLNYQLNQEEGGADNTSEFLVNCQVAF